MEYFSHTVRCSNKEKQHCLFHKIEFEMRQAFLRSLSGLSEPDKDGPDRERSGKLQRLSELAELKNKLSIDQKNLNRFFPHNVLKHGYNRSKPTSDDNFDFHETEINSQRNLTELITTLSNEEDSHDKEEEKKEEEEDEKEEAPPLRNLMSMKKSFSFRKRKKLIEIREQQGGLETEERATTYPKIHEESEDVDDNEQGDSLGWNKSQVTPTQTGISVLKTELLDRNKLKKFIPSKTSCSQQQYNDMVEHFTQKLCSRDAVISSFEHAVEIQQDVVETLRRELEQKNEVIAQLKEEKTQERRTSMELKLDLSEEKRITKKLRRKMKRLDEDLKKLKNANDEREAKNESHKKKLNELIRILKAQVRSKDDALNQVVNSFAKRKRTISNLVQSVQNVEEDLLSRVSDCCTLLSQSKNSFGETSNKDLMP